MKTTQYQCPKCQTPTFFKVRESGNVPETIGCMKPKCDGRSVFVPYAFNPTGKTDAIFFKPKNGEEWKLIERQLKFEIRGRFPGKKIKEVQRLANDVMFQFRSFVDNGGLLFLPMKYFETPKMKVVK